MSRINIHAAGNWFNDCQFTQDLFQISTNPTLFKCYAILILPQSGNETLFLFEIAPSWVKGLCRKHVNLDKRIPQVKG